ncbi:hypothetical protein CIW52_12615 [Mycolicibacterium sp. P9-64]|uniref:hypothetical protein n=1 Tax=Mycolicibacterium sp. P9-64 TaxID=2024612 RepID=UPI0011EBBBFD|nr:hypothetical protein [Mycolicibacterium sp. P9-64]KAA0083272.1 hypothetical protein CIW52_12615 [Mycolicibacterium sp. P9-64]
MSAPTSEDLGALLGRDLDSGQAVQILAVVTAMASAYTRDIGFVDGVPNDGIRAVILTAAARLLSNPRGLLLDESHGPDAVSYRSAFTGWSLAELFVLDRYRVRAW